MIADKVEAEEREPRRIALSIHQQERGIPPRFSDRNERSERLENAWTAYPAKIAFIQAVYSDKGTREKALRPHLSEQPPLGR
jgi:hypothetical protein